MTPQDTDVEERLLRLERETRELVPSAGFSTRVMLAVQAESAIGGFVGFSRAARRVLPIAVFLAIGAVSCAVDSVRTADEALAVSYGALELEW